MKKNFALRDYQKPIVEDCLKVREGQCVVSTGAGKCHRKGTEILMYDGSLKKIENIVIGDQVMGDNSTPRNVLNTCEGESVLYKISPTKGEPFFVKHDHKLSLKHTVKKTIINISVEDYLQQNKTFKHVHKLYRVPVEFEETDLLLDPYFIGIWLADGTASTSQITNPDKEIWCFLKKYAPSLNLIFKKYKYKDQCETLNLVMDNKKTKISLASILRKLNLIQNKHIPKNYLINSRKNRLELLAGLLDGDGHMSNNGFDFISKHKYISKDVVFLCRSLGLAAYMRPCIKRIKKLNFSGKYYRVSISGDCSIIPNKVKRKQAGKRKQKKDPLVTSFKVTKCRNKMEYAGIVVDGNKLFVQGDFFVTHNTVIALEVIRRLGLTATILVHKTDLLEQFAQEAKEKFGYEVGKIYSKEKTIRDITVATFQSFKSNPEILEQLADQTSILVVDECGMAVTSTRIAILEAFRPKYLYGLTATPFRDDGQSEAIGFFFGKKAVEFHLAQLTPRIDAYYTNYHIDVDDYHVMIDELVEHEKRNKLIIGSVGAMALSGRKVLVLTKRIKHAEILYEHFKMWEGAHLIESRDKNKNAKLLELKKGKKKFQIIFGTTALLSVGTDIPALDTLVLACDMKGAVLTTQSCGRVLRLFEGKDDPLIVDIVDNKNPILFSQYKKRHALYKSKGWKVNHMPFFYDPDYVPGG